MWISCLPARFSRPYSHVCLIARVIKIVQNCSQLFNCQWELSWTIWALWVFNSRVDSCKLSPIQARYECFLLTTSAKSHIELYDVAKATVARQHYHNANSCVWLFVGKYSLFDTFYFFKWFEHRQFLVRDVTLQLSIDLKSTTYCVSGCVVRQFSLKINDFFSMSHLQMVSQVTHSRLRLQLKWSRNLGRVG